MSVLTKINKRAKQIHKRGGSYAQAIKKASAEYRAGRLGRVTRSRKPARKRHRKISGVFSPADPLSTITGTRKRRTVRTGQTIRVKHVVAGINQHVQGAKELLVKRIGDLEALKFKVSKKSAKRKIGKLIAAAKRKYRAICR